MAGACMVREVARRTELRALIQSTGSVMSENGALLPGQHGQDGLVEPARPQARSPVPTPTRLPNAGRLNGEKARRRGYDGNPIGAISKVRDRLSKERQAAVADQ